METLDLRPTFAALYEAALFTLVEIDHGIHGEAGHKVRCFVIHKTLRRTPAMAAGITDRLSSLEDIAERIEVGKPASAKRGPYKKREA